MRAALRERHRSLVPDVRAPLVTVGRGSSYFAPSPRTGGGSGAHSIPCGLRFKDFFLTTISKKFHNQIQVSATLLSDTEGRTSNLYIKLGPKSVLVYQPGTLMFETGVRALSDLGQYNEKGTQLMNGPVLGLAGAVFLAGFLDDLSYAYLETCKAIRGQNSGDGEFDCKIYRLCFY